MVGRGYGDRCGGGAQYMKYAFRKGDLFWPDISVLVQVIVGRWMLNTHTRSQLIGGAEFPGKVCSWIKLESTSRHEAMLQQGQFNDTCCFADCTPSGDRPDPRYFCDDDFVIRLQQIVFGHAFEKAKARAQQKWPKQEDWPPILDVARHLRNAAFHDNRFFFKSKEPRGAPTWRTLQITKALAGQIAFGNACGTIGLGDVPVFLAEMMRELA